MLPFSTSQEKNNMLPAAIIFKRVSSRPWPRPFFTFDFSGGNPQPFLWRGIKGRVKMSPRAGSGRAGRGGIGSAPSPAPAMGANNKEKGGDGQMEDSAWLNKMKKKVEEEMARKEAEVISYWKGEIEKVLAKKHEGLGALQLEMQQFLQRMQNRIKVLRQSLGG
jgi:hypothetical protein